MGDHLLTAVCSHNDIIALIDTVLNKKKSTKFLLLWYIYIKKSPPTLESTCLLSHPLSHSDCTIRVVTHKQGWSLIIITHDIAVSCLSLVDKLNVVSSKGRFSPLSYAVPQCPVAV